MNRYKIIEKNKYNYMLRDDKGEIFFMNLEFYDMDKEPGIGDYVYLPIKMVNEKNIYSFGRIFNNIDYPNDDDIIKTIVDGREIYLERYYG